MIVVPHAVRCPQNPVGQVLKHGEADAEALAGRLALALTDLLAEELAVREALAAGWDGDGERVAEALTGDLVWEALAAGRDGERVAEALIDRVVEADGVEDALAPRDVEALAEARVRLALTDLVGDPLVDLVEEVLVDLVVEALIDLVEEPDTVEVAEFDAGSRVGVTLRVAEALGDLVLVAEEEAPATH